MAEWLTPDGVLLLTIDLEPGSDVIWNRNAGFDVEAPDEHGDVTSLIAEAAAAGFRLIARETLRALPGTRTDVTMMRFEQAPRQ